MPDPTIVGVGTEVTNTTTGAVTLTAAQPSGARNGDLLLAVFRQDYQHSTGSGNVRLPTTPTGTISTATRGAALIGGTNTQRVSLAAWAIPRTSSTAISVPVSAGTGAANVYEALTVLAVRNCSDIANIISQHSDATSWPTSAETLTVGADNSSALSIITNRSATAQTLDTANGFTVSTSSTTQPAYAVAYRTVNTPSQAVPQWTGSGNLRAQVTFELEYGPAYGGIYVDGAVHLA